MVHLAVTGTLVLGLALALWRLPPLHPVQLWLAAWSVSLFLYSLQLLPYLGFGVLTGALILGAAGAFAAGVLLAERTLSRPLRRRLRPLTAATDSPAVKTAAAATLAATATLLAAFLAQATISYGLGDTLVSSSSVRVAVQEGEFAITVKYVYFALAAVPLALLAAWLSEGRERWWWGIASIAAALTIYFTTARSAVWLAAGSALTVWALVGPRIELRRSLYTTGGLGLVAILLLLGGGALIGKTYDRSEMASIRTSFSGHEYLQPLAIPYEYATASIPALDLQVKAEPTWGHADGCATLAPACRVLGSLGFQTDAVRSIRPFTASPVRWNLYTALDRPVMDGGPALAVPIILVLGLLVGLAWTGASIRSAGGLFAYSLVAPALLFSSAGNLAASEHFIGALLFGGVALGGGRYLARSRVAQATPL